MKVLVLSSDRALVADVRRSLAPDKQWRVFSAGKQPQAERALHTARPRVVLLDTALFESCRGFLPTGRGRRFALLLVCHGTGGIAHGAAVAAESRATDILRYPFHPVECRLRVQAAYRAFTASARTDRLLRQRRISQAHLDECAARLSAVSNSIPAGIVIIDPETHVIVDANAEALRLFGAAGEEVVGRICHHYICPAQRGACPITDNGLSVDRSERFLVNARGEQVPILKTVTRANLGGKDYLFEMFIDISDRKQAEAERDVVIQRPQQALLEVKTLSGLLPICAACKKIRDDQGYWSDIELYIQEHSEAQFTHGICPDCMRRLYPESASS